jgi:hypothetical protein
MSKLESNLLSPRQSLKAVTLIAAACWCSVCHGQSRTGSARERPETGANTAASRASTHWKSFDPAGVVGAWKCIDCHRSEFMAWRSSKHATTVFDDLRVNPNSQAYAQALAIDPSDIARSSICTNCHATRQRDRAGQLHILGGVSCESCHNAAGGEDGWLNRHSVYGYLGVGRKDETPAHYQSRTMACQKAGQYRSSDIYQLAKACFQCHIVGDERLVNDSNHKPGSQEFDFVNWTLGEVRHNFLLDQSRNSEAPTLWADARRKSVKQAAEERRRLMFVLATLADLEVSLRLRSDATADGRFSKSLNDRIQAAHELLLGIRELAPITEFDDLQESLGATIQNLNDVSDDTKAACIAAADQVASAAVSFAQAHDGSQLGALDDVIPNQLRGEVFQFK